MFLQRLFTQDSYATLEKTAVFTERRQHCFANNIANAATPYYRRQDLDVSDFNKTMQKAIDGSKQCLNNQYDFKDGQHTFFRGQGGLISELQVQPGVNQLRHDQDNVDIEKEMVEMTKNEALHKYSMELIRQKNGIMAQAIRERLT